MWVFSLGGLAGPPPPERAECQGTVSADASVTWPPDRSPDLGGPLGVLPSHSQGRWKFLRAVGTQDRRGNNVPCSRSQKKAEPAEQRLVTCGGGATDDLDMTSNSRCVWVCVGVTTTSTKR